MVNYKYGKIYKITNTINNKEYYGSTANPYLKSRFNKHKSAAKDKINYNGLIYQEIRLLGIVNFKIELVEDYSCETRKELSEREQYYIDLYKPVLNENRAIEDPNYEKKRYIRDKVKRLALTKAYYEKNKEQILEKQKIKITCEICNCEMSKSSYNKHIKNPKHLNLVKAKEIIN